MYIGDNYMGILNKSRLYIGSGTECPEGAEDHGGTNYTENES